MPFIRIWVHMVFSTKNREEMLNDNIRKQVFKHIKEYAAKKDIWLDHIGGYREHAHCLISLHSRQSIDKVAQLIKGESSSWINKTFTEQDYLKWQNDYWAVSVSESHVDEVREYIKRQELHHKEIDFNTEINEFTMKYGGSKIKNKKSNTPD
jgi:putative transposase